MKRMTILLTLIFAGTVSAQLSPQTQIQTYLFSSQYDSAIVLIENSLALDSTLVDLNHQLGLAHFLQNDDRKALSCFEKFYKLHPDDLSNLNYLSKAYNNLGQTTKAIQILKQAIQIDSTRKDIWNELGKILYREGRYQEADSAYSVLATLQPDNANNQLMRARCASKTDSLEKADTFYFQAYQLDTSHVKILFEYARNLFMSDSLDEALTYVDKAITLEDRDWHLHRLKGDIHYKKHFYPAAILAYLDAITRGDNSIAVLKKLGFSYYMDKNYTKCLTALQQVVEAENNDPIVYFYMGICFQQIDECELAIQHLQNAIDCLQPPFLGDIYSTLAECQHKQNNHAEAIRNFKNAMPYSDEKTIIYYQLANVYNDYYADKTVALSYYQLARKKEIAPEITRFIDAQISNLKTQLFMKN